MINNTLMRKMLYNSYILLKPKQINSYLVKISRKKKKREKNRKREKKYDRKKEREKKEERKSR